MTNPGLLPPRDTVQCFLYQKPKKPKRTHFLAPPPPPPRQKAALCAKRAPKRTPKEGGGLCALFCQRRGDAVTR